MILVVGGAGYIGSHMVRKLADQGRDVLVLDDLSTGHAKAVDARAALIQGDLGDTTLLDGLFAKYAIEGVMHFAAKSLVPESVCDPAKYYVNNVAKTTALLGAMLRASVKSFVFSSTAATYGSSETPFIQEGNATVPINPYGRSKLMVETILADYAQAYGLRYTAFRYFNAAGAHHSGTIGEDHTPESHLLPIIFQHLLGQRKEVSVFGDDYDTRDGTCIRDYVHVEDLADAHFRALDLMLAGDIDKRTFNLASQAGYSVKEVIESVQKVTGRDVRWSIAPRRAGDPPRLVASSDKAKRELGWAPQHDLKTMIETAWRWHQSHPHGYVD